MHRLFRQFVLARLFAVGVRMRVPNLCLLIAVVAVPASDAADALVPASPPAVEIPNSAGSLVICGGGSLDEQIVEHFVSLAGRDQARLVIVATASAKASQSEAQQDWIDSWGKRGIADAKVIHAANREEAEGADFCSQLDAASAVWFIGGQQSRLAQIYCGTPFEESLQALLARGGVIGGTSAGAAIMSRIMIQSGNPTPVITRGLGLLESFVIDQHFTERNRLPRLQSCIRQHRSLVGLGIDEGTALIIRGRTARVVGAGKVTGVCAEPDGQRCLELKYSHGSTLDLVALHRAAVVRSQGGFPPQNVATRAVPNGHLVVVGGGGMPRDVVDEFIRLAGGRNARIVVLPTAVDDRTARRATVPRFIRDAGVADARVLPQRRREEVESKEFLETLEAATGIWFGGGRQWRFVDAYSGTKAYDAIWSVLLRGGVIGGSSAGASIQAEYMVRGNPLGNRDMMALGYQQGFGFLPGVAIDQHFSQRKRFADLAGVIRQHPQYLGIGIDEATALVMSGSQGRVLGRGAVHLYVGRDRGLKEWRPDLRIPTGGRIDLLSLHARPAPPDQPRE